MTFGYCFIPCGVKLATIGMVGIQLTKRILKYFWPKNEKKWNLIKQFVFSKVVVFSCNGQIFVRFLALTTKLL
jgi:hypothetical protein